MSRPFMPPYSHVRAGFPEGSHAGPALRSICAVALCAVGLTWLASARTAHAGGRLETLSSTGVELAPGIELVRSIPIFWDERCARVDYTLDTIPPNAGTPLELDIETVRAELQASMDPWNRIPTSYIEMNVTRVATLGNGVRGFDFVNELSFEAPDDFMAAASSPSTSLPQDTTLAPGDDLDADGDSDVYDPALTGRNVCTDIDGDGDIEFPAGFYLAGTILDNDVMFNPRIVFEVGSNSPVAVDLRAVATHEFGHSHGLSHSVLNLISASDGTASTMFPVIEQRDPVAELSTRSLHDDDVAWSSMIYPEGSGSGPLASLAPGDVAFADVFTVLRGNVNDVTGIGVPGANVYARSLDGSARIPVGAFAGSVFVARLVGTAQLALLPPALGVVNGSYALPLPNGNYEVFVQPPDVETVVGSAISLTATVGLAGGQHMFDEEGLSTLDVETRGAESDPGRSRHVAARIPNPVQAADFVVQATNGLASFGPAQAIGDPVVIGQPQVVYATRYPNAAVRAQLESGARLTTGLFRINVIDPSQVARIERASLVLARLAPDGRSVDRGSRFELRVATRFVAQDGDLHPFYFAGADGLSGRLRNELARDPTLDLFLLVEVPDAPVVGISGLPPLLGVSLGDPISESFLSIGGGPLTRLDGRNWIMQLGFSAPLDTLE